MFPNGVALKES